MIERDHPRTLQFGRSDFVNELAPLVCQEEKIRADLQPQAIGSSVGVLPDEHEARLDYPLNEDIHRWWPVYGGRWRDRMQFEEKIHLQLGEFIVDEAKVELVEAKTFTVNFSSVGAPVAIRTKCDEVVILVRLTLRPRDNVMNVSFDVSAGGDSAPVPRLDEDPPSDVSRYWLAPTV